MICQLATKILGMPVTSCEAVTGGLNNQLYHIQCASGDYALRIPRAGNAQWFDYAREAQVIEIIRGADLEPETLYDDPQTGIKLSRWVDHLQTMEKGFNNEDLIAYAGLLRRLHSLPSVGAFQPDVMLERYLSALTQPIYDLSFARHLQTSCADHTGKLVLCHNDLVAGNLVKDNHRHWLIDFEYASGNDPCFDLMSLITENDLLDQNQRTLFLETYFGHPISESLQAKLDYWEAFHHLLWCAWAMMESERTHRSVYQTIAHHKYIRLRQCLGVDTEKDGSQ